MEIDIAGELARQIVQVLGVLVIAVCGYLIRRLLKSASDFHDNVFARLDHIDECIDAMKELNADERTVIHSEISYLKGKAGIPLKEEVR